MQCRGLRLLLVGLCLDVTILSVTAAFQLPATLVSRSFDVRMKAQAQEINGAGPTSDNTPIDDAVAITDNNYPIKDESVALLNDAIRFYNSSSGSKLLSTITEMRSNSDKNGAEEAIIDFLDNLLANGPDGPLPVWTRLRIFSRFSKRARLMSLRRLLDLSSPPPAEGQREESEELKKQRRRRGLVSVLRTLSDTSPETTQRIPAVVELEKKARKASASISDSEDITARRPSNLETPKYSVVEKKKFKDTTYEIRRYEPFSVCSVLVDKPRPANSDKTDAKVSMPQVSGASSFGALAGYLFGKNQESTAMKMTTPVLMNGENESRQMSFVLPSEYWGSGLTTAPKPFDESGVKLEEVKGGEKAVVMFGGFASKKQVESRKKQLLKALSKDDDWEAVDELVSTAQYNDPFTAPWKRLNEVSISVIPRPK